MENQANMLKALVIEEDVKRLVILAHSMGGPIAVSLIESLAHKTDIALLSLIYLEGNLDTNDAYLSGKFAAHTFEEYTQVFQKRLENIEQKDPDLYETTKAVGPFPFWASSVDLVEVSRSNELLPRILEHEDLSLHFIFGEGNRGRFSSEDLVKRAGLPPSYIPDAGHMMYLDNPTDFWPVIFGRLDGGRRPT